LQLHHNLVLDVDTQSVLRLLLDHPKRVTTLIKALAANLRRVWILAQQTDLNAELVDALVSILTIIGPSSNRLQEFNVDLSRATGPPEHPEHLYRILSSM